MNGAPQPGAQQDQRQLTLLALGATLIPLFFAAMFALTIIGTYHKPHPNGIKVGVVGPPPLTAPLRAGIERQAGSAFEISQVTTVGEAAHDVRQRDLNAAFIPSANPRQPATLIVASANGRIVATAAETLARAVTSAQGGQLTVQEVRPLASGDEIGLGVFMFIVVCTICGYITPTVLETLVPGLLPNRRYPIIAATSFLVSLFVYLIGGLGWGTFTGSFGTILAFIAVGALYTFTVGLGTRLFQVLLGPPGIFASLSIFVFLNIPSLGATYTHPVLPSFWQFINHFWVGAAAVNAERAILYFGGQGVAGDLLVLLAWTAVIVAALLLPVSRKLERQRERSVGAGAVVSPARRLASAS